MAWLYFLGEFPRVYMLVKSLRYEAVLSLREMQWPAKLLYNLLTTIATDAPVIHVAIHAILTAEEQRRLWFLVMDVDVYKLWTHYMHGAAHWWLLSARRAYFQRVIDKSKQSKSPAAFWTETRVVDAQREPPIREQRVFDVFPMRALSLLANRIITAAMGRGLSPTYDLVFIYPRDLSKMIRERPLRKNIAWNHWRVTDITLRASFRLTMMTWLIQRPLELVLRLKVWRWQSGVDDDDGRSFVDNLELDTVMRLGDEAEWLRRLYVANESLIMPPDDARLRDAWQMANTFDDAHAIKVATKDRALFYVPTSALTSSFPLYYAPSDRGRAYVFVHRRSWKRGGPPADVDSVHALVGFDSRAFSLDGYGDLERTYAEAPDAEPLTEPIMLVIPEAIIR